MFNFGNTEQNNQIPYFQGMYNGYPVYRAPAQSDNQRTLQTLRVQNDYLVTEINGIKEVLGQFMTEVKERLTELNQGLAHLQRVSETQKPRKKFKKAIHCPYEECGRRYSSKIALNCHIRTKHRNQRE